MNVTIDSHYEDTLEGAEEILNTLIEAADMYGCVYLADYYEIFDGDSDYADTIYGWSPELIKQTTIRTTRKGYILDLPRPIKIEDIGGVY